MGGMMEVLNRSYNAAADLSAKTGYAMALSTTVNVPTVQGQDCIGVLLNAPSAANQQASIGMLGVYPVKLGGTVTALDPLACDSTGKLIRWRPGDTRIGKALESGVSGDEIDAFIDPENPYDMYFVLNDITAIYIAVAAHTVAGEVDIPDAGQEIIGITQAAGGVGDSVKVRTFGVSTFTAASGGVTCGDPLETDNAGGLDVKGDGSSGANLVGVALATVAGAATGLCFIKPMGTTIS